MATITIRNVDQAVYDRLKQDAKANHRSLEAEARSRLGSRRMSRNEIVDRLRAAQIVPGPSYQGSIAEIRAIRDEE